ncbi:aminoglycoside phosphotransferase family protein [Kibdelosporangium phytohabitans]|uniref:Aminoglycoside phosphotransferase n=1 Tax=Kibdelosporangium phytohabitans TaxID=860235 RepID=A0A0N9HWJ5_9PSEU|nr:aminoglycoside phosphotransferase family protein [Kibdelosporangium phytohabitans]ALG07820.1 hypothetical protein AOZ06_13680 [Kibdelosporangium phytohabitans]MBE1471257.1 streptomycin 6-kinase [Kibdelosporangium phytohabitans]
MNLDPARARMARRFGPEAHAWMDALPARITELAERWGLKVGEPYPTGNSSVAVRCDDVVLKLSPQVDFLAEQVRVLRMYEPSGRVPKVFQHEDGAMVMEIIEPGTFVTEAPPPAEFAALMADLHAVGDPAIAERDIRTALEEFFVRVENRGVDIGSARQLRDELVATQDDVVLLHGDLHFNNILAGPRGLMVIDPKACAGDRAFDTIDYAMAAPDRVRELADAASLDVDRIVAWRQVLHWVDSPP